jgi:hypothetical protein
MERLEQALLTAADQNLFTPDFIEHAVTWEVHAGAIKAPPIGDD